MSLQEDSRNEQEGGTLQKKSHAPMCLLDKISKMTLNSLPNREVILIDTC